QSFFERLDKLRARSAVVELPGRALGTIAPADAARLMLREAQREWEADQWTLAEPPEGRAVIEALVQEQRRRLRRGL
ncbi:MAG: hypothetical protein JNK04_17200, partial [Myxococcales bacterium]|nr:hypothetical protein [Myxococcales bacterium]